MRHIYTSIDIGTDTIKVVVCELFHNKLNLLATSSTKSKGIKKGLIADVKEASISLKNAVDEIEGKLGITIKNVVASIPSYFASFSLIKGSVDIKDDGIVSGDDVVRVLQSGMPELESKQEMVTIMPIDFICDGVVTKDPKGIKCKVLQSRAVLATTPAKNVYSVITLLENCGLEAVDISLNGIGDMYAFRTKDMDNKVGAIINIGSETTNVSLYNKGIIVKNSVLGIGGKAIDNDISYMYKTSMIEAKRVKEKFAIADKKYASSNDLYEITSENGQTTKVNQVEISDVVMARLEEILVDAKKEINDLTNKKIEYIIITGGSSNMSHLEYLLDEVFGPIAKIACINLIGVRNNKYSSALGNIIYYLGKQRLKGQSDSMISAEDEEALSSVKKNLINISNESMLGKVVGYFFGE